MIDLGAEPQPVKFAVAGYGRLTSNTESKQGSTTPKVGSGVGGRGVGSHCGSIQAAKLNLAPAQCDGRAALLGQHTHSIHALSPSR